MIAPPAPPAVDLVAMRLLAGHLSDRYRGRWMILFGVTTREFIAFAKFEHPAGQWVSAPDPATLQERMAEFERACAS